MENEREWFCILRQMAVLSVHLFIVSCVTFFLDVESNIKRAFLAVYCLPVVIRISGFAQSDLLLVHNFATALLILGVIYYFLCCAPMIFSHVKSLYLYAGKTSFQILTTFDSPRNLVVMHHFNISNISKQS